MAVLGSLATAALLAGCAGAVNTAPAPYAADPLCAEVLRTSPATLGGQEERSTTSQASGAWGDPAISLRCGVEPPGPTTDRCLAVSGPTDEVVDWVMTEEGTGQGEEGNWTFTTFGRAPAVEVVIPVQFAGDAPTEILVEMEAAIQLIPQTRQCL